MRRWPYRAWLLAGVLIALVIGCVGPTSWQDTALQHIPTVVSIGLLTWWGTHRDDQRLSDTSHTLLAAFLLLHILGAHYLYSNVPYDDWSLRLTGRSISEVFGWQRNHYDRLVHLIFGVVCAAVMFEIGVRFARLGRWWSLLLAVGVVSIFANVYEVAEWLIAELMTKENAEQYNGQQGDVFDPQKDIALSFGGSVAAGVVCALRAGKSRAPASRA